MSHPGFGNLWKQAEMSDIEIVLSVANDASVTASPAADETSDSQTRTVLQQFPGHSPILSPSPYFAAQVRPSLGLQHINDQFAHC
jgi:hypothetical protein